MKKEKKKETRTGVVVVTGKSGEMDEERKNTERLNEMGWNDKGSDNSKSTR